MPVLMSKHVNRHNIAFEDNSPVGEKAKVQIRRNVLDAIGADQAHVFDAFAGAGRMHGAVWQHAADYTGCDTKFFRDGRRAYVADNRRVLRTLDLGRFNIVDLDSYGSPWEQVFILSARRRLQPGEVFGLVLTEGSALKMKFGQLPLALAQLAGMHKRMSGMIRAQGSIYDKAIKTAATRMNATVTRRWQAEGRSGSLMRYIGLVLTGLD